MKKIIVFGFTDYMGGIENYYITFYKKLFKSYSIDFITSNEKMAFEEFVEANGSKVYHVPNIKKHPIKYYKVVSQIIKENKYDVVHDNKLSAANILNLIIAKRCNVKTIIAHSHCTGVSGHFIKKVLHLLNKNKLKKYANVFLACSDEAAKWLFPSKTQYLLINNAINLDRFLFNNTNRKNIRNKYFLKDSDYVVGHVGRFSYSKNHKFIIELAKRIDDKSIKFMFVGNGEDKEKIEKIILNNELSHKIIIVNETNEVEKYYSAFDCFVFPSLFEGLGIATIEAQVNGLRCLFSENIVKNVDILDYNNYLSLKNISKWVDILLEKKTYSRNVNKKVFSERGFDIENEINKLKNIYEKG